MNPTSPGRSLLRRGASAAVLTALVSCGLPPRNPYDENTPPAYQAAARLDGTIQAVYAPYEEDAQGALRPPEAASCAPLAGDHAGFEVVLRGLGTASDNAGVRVQSQQTDASGVFAFINIQPGDYTVEFLRAGFELPPPLTVHLAAGERLTLPTRCAVDRTPPARPQIAPLPAATVADSVELVVLSCDPLLRPDERFDVVRSQPDGSDRLALELPDASGACQAPLSLLPAEPAAARTRWRVEVRARDALGNTSEALVVELVRDTRPPPAPVDLQARVGRERVELRWSQPAAVGDDDEAVSWWVSYSVVPRPASLATVDCPHGAFVPGDPFDSARFAVEGPSPLPSSVPSLLLNGLQPGTDLYLQVAAADGVGNTSCWSAPLAVRPDLIAPSWDGRQEDVPVARAVARSGAARAFARGSGGLTVRADSGASEDLSLPSSDVVAGRSRFFAAGGALGVHEVIVDVEGAVVSARSVDVGHSVQALAARPGVLVLGTATGVGVVRGDLASPASHHVPGGVSAPTERVLNWGAALILLRAAQPHVVQVVRRDAPAELLGTVGDLGAGPADLEILGDTLWLALDGRGVQAVDLGACAEVLAAPADGGVAAGEVGCLDPRLPVPLPVAARARAVAPFDDLVAIAAEAASAGTASAGLYFLRSTADQAPAYVGRLGLPDTAEVLALEASAPGLCVTTREGASVQRRCAMDLGQDLLGESMRLFFGLPVEQALVDGPLAWLLEGGGTDVLSFAPALRQVALGQAAAQRSRQVPLNPPIDPSGSALHERFPFGAPWLTGAAVLPDLGVVGLDVYGRLWFSAASALPGDGELLRVDDDLPARLAAALPALERSAAGGTWTYLTAGSVERAGLDLLLTLQNSAADTFACHPAALARLALVEDVDSGALGAGALETVALEDSVALYGPVVDGGVAWMGMQPFGLARVELGASLLAPAGQGLAADCANHRDDGSYVYGVLRPLLAPASLVLSGLRTVGGVDETGVYLWDGGAPERVNLQLPAAPEALADLGPRLFVATDGAGAFAVDLPTRSLAAEPSYPRLALPELRRPGRVVTTSRGLLVPDGLYGAAWVVVQ